MVHTGTVGDAHIIVEAALDPRRGQSAVNLRTIAMHQNQPHTETVQQRQVVEDGGKVGVLCSITPQHQDKGPVPVGIDVGRRIPEPANMAAAWGGHVAVSVLSVMIVRQEYPMRAVATNANFHGGAAPARYRQ